jgi:nucleotide-binding universal stress UspA family protein
MRLLIAYDGSDCAKVAIDDLRRAGLPGDVDARVLSVANVFPHLARESADAAPPGGDDAMSRVARHAAELAKQAVSDAAALAAEGATRVQGLFPAWKVHAHACGDSPHWGIITEAHAWNADLIVVGAHGRSAVSRLILGSVSQAVLAHAPCSVRIGRRAAAAAAAPGAPTAAAEDKPIRLVIGVDSSVGAATAVSAVAARHWPAGTEAAIVTAIDLQLATALPMILGTMEMAATAGDDQSLVTKSLQRVARELEEAGLRVTPVVSRGSPKRLLLSEAQTRLADCIFVGARGLSRVERLVLGSVSTSVANHAPCSVEIIRD